MSNTECPCTTMNLITGNNAPCTCAAQYAEAVALQERIAANPDAQKSLARHRELVADAEALEASYRK